MEYVEVARAESERGEVVLRERRATDPRATDPRATDPRATEPTAPAVLELRVNGVFVMDTGETGTEKALASAALGRVEHPRRVLVGGLGLGFTVHEVLADARVEEVVVVEIEDAVVRWMRDGTVPHGPGFLADDRVSVVTADVTIAMAEAAADSYDLVLLDIDNGPEGLVHDHNQVVYGRRFLERALAAIRPGGALVIWSAAPSAALQEAMTEVFGNATPIPYDVTLQGRQEQYWLYLARRPTVGAP